MSACECSHHNWNNISLFSFALSHHSSRSPVPVCECLSQLCKEEISLYSQYHVIINNLRSICWTERLFCCFFLFFFSFSTFCTVGSASVMQSIDFVWHLMNADNSRGTSESNEKRYIFNIDSIVPSCVEWMSSCLRVRTSTIRFYFFFFENFFAFFSLGTHSFPFRHAYISDVD